MATKVIASSIRSFVCIVLDLLQGPAPARVPDTRPGTVHQSISRVHVAASGYLTREYPVGEAQVPRYQPSTEIPRPNPSQSPALESQPGSVPFSLSPFPLLLSIELMSFFLPLVFLPPSHSLIRSQAPKARPDQPTPYRTLRNETNQSCSGKQTQIQQQSRESNFALLHMLTAECLDAGEATVRGSAAAGVGVAALRGAVSPVHDGGLPVWAATLAPLGTGRSARSRRWRAVFQALQWTSFCAAAPPSVSGPARPG
jgi:hypothetical protein